MKSRVAGLHGGQGIGKDLYTWFSKVEVITLQKKNVSAGIFKHSTHTYHWRVTLAGKLGCLNHAYRNG